MNCYLNCNNEENIGKFKNISFGDLGFRRNLNEEDGDVRENEREINDNNDNNNINNNLNQSEFEALVKEIENNFINDLEEKDEIICNLKKRIYDLEGINRTCYDLLGQINL